MATSPLHLRRRRGLTVLALLAVVLVAGAWAEWRYIGPLPFAPGERPDAPAALAKWPWPQAVQDTPHLGVTHWFDTSSPDGTTLDLFDFDFGANPRLRFELYDQDEDDAKPFDNKAHPRAMGVAQAARHLNQSGRGTVLAACNGLYYDFDTWQDSQTASHVAPVVLNGQTHYAQVENHRWTFGVKYDVQGRPHFKMLHMPPISSLAHAFDFASGGAHGLIDGGKPLPLPPYPGQPSAHPAFATMKTCRVSLAWTADSRHLYLLFVKEPDAETISEWAMRHDIPLQGGWSLEDEQKFWLSHGGIANAINSDGGGVAQLVYRLPDGRYGFVPSNDEPDMRRTLPADLSDAPGDGSLMDWFVRETP